jgi:DNA-binding NarL/FixJ family response regulator
MLATSSIHPVADKAALRVLLADDHELVREGIREVLEERPGWEVCCATGDGREAVSMAAHGLHQVAILDLGLPGLGGIEATRELTRVSPTTEVMICTAHDSPELVREAVANGAHAFVLKTDGAAQLVRGVEALSRRQTFFSSGVPRSCLEAMPQARARHGRGELTTRELEVVRFLAEGKSNWCIATILGISVRTVETHRAKVMAKLGLQSIVEVVHYAVRRGIVAP